MADTEGEDFSSKRIRLSPEREIEGISPSKVPKTDTERRLVDEELFLSNLSAFQETSLSSREQDGGNNEIQKHEQFENDDFSKSFSVEDDIEYSEEHHYQPIAGPMGWVQRQMTLGINPREILSYMVPNAKVPSVLEDNNSTLWKIIIDLLMAPTPRHKLETVNTLDDVANLMNTCKNIVVLTGAGVSVSCGIPDFRSRDGIYAHLSEEYPDLPDPQAMFDITYFNQNPKPFFKFAKEIFPGQFKPSLSHRFIQQIEAHGRLLRNYSQNIDTLEQIAGITRIIQCHGSFSTASCTNCKYQVSSYVIKDDIFNQKIPLCPKCKQEEGLLPIMKPDIVFFGENLPSDFYHNLEEDSEKADMLIVIGSSLKVRPVALIPSRIAEDVPQILINREPLRHMNFDVELLGDCDVIVKELCKKLGGKWTSILDGTEVPPVSRELYTGVLDEVNTDTPSQNTISEKTITVEPSGENKLENTEPYLNPSRDSLDQYEHQLFSVSNQASINIHKQQLHEPEQDKQLLQREEASSKSLIKASSSSVPENPPETSQQQEQAHQTFGHSTGPFGAATTVQDPIQPIVGCQHVDVDISSSSSMASISMNNNINSTEKETQNQSALSDMSAVCQYPSNQDDTTVDTDSQTYIFLPPSRYIFYGAEISNSPLHSPFGSPVHDSDADSENYSNSEHGSLTKDGPEMSVLEGNGYNSSGDGSEGYESGAMSATDLSNYELKLITGALGEYSCVSEENSVMSGVELFSEENREGRLDSLAYVPPSEFNIHQSDTSGIGPLVENYKDNIDDIVGLHASNLSSHLDSLAPSTEPNVYGS